jgi:hypothetical protein
VDDHGFSASPKAAATPLPVYSFKEQARAVAADAAEAAAKKMLTPVFIDKVKGEAEVIGHICDDWEFNVDDESPVVWCPACRHVDEWRHEMSSELARLSPPPEPKVYAGPSWEEKQEARYRAWVAGLKPLQKLTLAAGGVEARILVKKEFLGHSIGFCDMMDMADPGWDTRVAPAPVKALPLPAPVAMKPQPKALAVVKETPKKAGMWAALDSDSEESEESEEELAPHLACAHHSSPAESATSWRRAEAMPEATSCGAAATVEEDEEGGWETAGAAKSRFPDPFGGFGVQQWLRRKDKRSAEAREKELASWLAEKPRRIYTAEGYQPAKKYENAKRSSLLVTGYGDGVGAADVRELAAICGPVRDVFRPRSGNLTFVEFMDPEAAGRAKALFADHAVVLGGRRLLFDISKPKADQKPKGK